MRLYTYYFKEESHRVFLADRESVVTFIQELFDEEWGEGIGVMLADTHFETVVMEKHDGVLVTRKEVFSLVYNA